MLAGINEACGLHQILCMIYRWMHLWVVWGAVVWTLSSEPATYKCMTFMLIYYAWSIGYYV